jgi:hypothetical protein
MISISKEEKKSLNKIFEYLADEDKHFLENCTCENRDGYEDASEASKTCKCSDNKNHIYRDVLKLHRLIKRLD